MENFQALFFEGPHLTKVIVLANIGHYRSKQISLKLQLHDSLNNYTKIQSFPVPVLYLIGFDNHCLQFRMYIRHGNALRSSRFSL